MKHLSAINDLSPDAIFSILEKARFYSIQLKQRQTIKPVLNGKLAANIFFENSTRTRFSFETAQKRLGAMTLSFEPQSSSLSKGESLQDTLRAFEAMGVDIAVIRHMDDDFIESVKRDFSFSVINAGAGKREHPSQSLLDLFTLQEEFEKLDGLVVAICGDIQNSRVAKSNIHAFAKVGIKTLLCGPEPLLPPQDELPSNCRISSLDEAVKVADAVMFLRVQKERHQTFELALDNYNNQYGLNQRRQKALKPGAIIMHPGPVNRGVEIESALVDGPQSRIYRQVENGVYARMAILDWLMEKK